MKNKLQHLKGTWHDIHNKGLSFDARRFHQVEPHQGRMWALAAYTPQAVKHATEEQILRLSSLHFPLPAKHVSGSSAGVGQASDES